MDNKDSKFEKMPKFLQFAKFKFKNVIMSQNSNLSTNFLTLTAYRKLCNQINFIIGALSTPIV